MASDRLCSFLDSTKPRLRQLITLELLIMLGQSSFALSFKMEFEEIDSVQEPTNVDILLPTSNEYWLLHMVGVSLSLRHVEVRYNLVTGVGVEG